MTRTPEGRTRRGAASRFLPGFRIGPGTAIVGGLLMALLSVWATGGDPGPGEHKLAVLATRVLMALAALSLHEWAHGAVAYALGDTTARDEGRLTLDPRAHFDPIGLLVFPGIMAAVGSPACIGWAKPVPVDFSRLRRPRLGMALVAAAGPASNIMAALFCGSLLTLLGVDGSASLAGSAAWTFAFSNLALGLFNLIPLYPMDGGRIVSSVLPGRARTWLMRHEGRAALATLAILVALPAVPLITRGAVDPVGSAANVLGEASVFLTGQHGISWYRPMQAWVASR